MGDVERGNAAKRLLEDEMVKEVFAALETDFHKEWKDAPTTEAREIAWYSQRAIEAIKAKLRRYKDSGTRALKEQK
jgi:predicted metal-dependent hydrolase